MRTILLALLTTIAAMAAGKGKCTSDIPIQLEILTTYIDGTPNAIQGDGAPYVNGEGGVTATVNLCDGTGDATMYLSATRQAFVNFGKMLSRTQYTPAWAASGSTIGCQGYNTCWEFNIVDIWYVLPGSNHSEEYEFTTELAGHGPLFSKLSMLSPNANVTLLQSPDANTPYPDSPVRVHHCPANFQGTSTLCGAGQHEQWFVWPDPTATQGGTSQTGLPITQVATLILNGGKPPGPFNGGEFSIPFYFKISALQ